jgi:hypothetical protein
MLTRCSNDESHISANVYILYLNTKNITYTSKNQKRLYLNIRLKTLKLRYSVLYVLQRFLYT